MPSIKPHIFFHSHMDSPEAWKSALKTQFDDFRFSTEDNIDDPDSVDVALLWTVPERGLRHLSNLRAVLSLGAGIDQINLDQLPEAVPIARLVDDSLTRTMTEYAKAAVYRYHRRLHIFEQHSRERIWEFIEPKAACETAVGVLGLGEVGSNIATALQRDGFKVYGWSRSVKSLEMIDTYGGQDGLLSMVGQCEIIVNVLPLTADTRTSWRATCLHILLQELASSTWAVDSMWSTRICSKPSIWDTLKRRRWTSRLWSRCRYRIHSGIIRPS